MPLSASELLEYAAADLVEDDTSTVGGAIDKTMRPNLTAAMGAASVITLVSDGADTRNVVIEYRDATGAYQSETIALNGATPVTTVGTAAWFLKAKAASTSGSRTVTITSAGPVTLGTIPPNEKGFYITFINSASDPSSPKTRYEKMFWYNSDGTLALLTATITCTADPAANITSALAATLDDSATVANRLTAPAGLSFVGDGVAQNVPTGNLGPGHQVGLWVAQALTAANAPIRNTYTFTIAGNSA